MSVLYKGKTKTTVYGNTLQVLKVIDDHVTIPYTGPATRNRYDTGILPTHRSKRKVQTIPWPHPQMVKTTRQIRGTSHHTTPNGNSKNQIYGIPQQGTQKIHPLAHTKSNTIKKGIKFFLPHPTPDRKQGGSAHMNPPPEGGFSVLLFPIWGCRTPLSGVV